VLRRLAPQRKQKGKSMRTIQAFPIMFLTALSVAVGQTPPVLSITRDGTLVWSCNQTNLFCGIEFKHALTDYWVSAPVPLWNIQTSNLTTSVELPAFPPLMFLRVVCSTNRLPGGETYDVNSNGIPQFVTNNYIELSKIHTISRFRSGEGHDYSDAFESCRSMKHYFTPMSDVVHSNILIFAPVAGTVYRIQTESTPNSGVQLWIKSSQYPAFYFVIFHMNPLGGVLPGAIVTSGQILGRHTGAEVVSDIAVRVDTPTGLKLLSYFDVMTDTLFQAYQSRGIENRAALIIAREERDADPLTCDGEEFLTGGNLPNLVDLD
jgi:hypothetical protein